MKKAVTTMLKAMPWILLIIFVIYLADAGYKFNHRTTSKELTYNELIGLAERGNIQEITVYDNGRVYGKFKVPIVEFMNFGGYIGKADQRDFTRRLLEIKPIPKIIKQPPSSFDFFGFFLLFIIGLIIVVFLWFTIRRLMTRAPTETTRNRMTGSKYLPNSNSRLAKRFLRVQSKTKPAKNTKFEDVGGIDEVKEELIEIVEFLKNPEKFRHLGGKMPKGVLLVGPPGTGKTLLAKAVAGEANAEFLSTEASGFVELYVGVGASRVRDLFERARVKIPCIVFIDELDAVGRKRSSGIGHSHEEREQTLNQLLAEMDGFDGREGIIVLSATNRPDILDPALLRPGRFDSQIHVHLPDIKGREEILKIHTRNKPLTENTSLAVVARMTPGFSGADLADLANKAALGASKKEKQYIEFEDFEKARDKIIMGLENRSLSLVMTEEEKRIAAYHETGHAIVAVTMPHSDPLHKVSIIPRKTALGITSLFPEKDRYNYSKDYLEELISILLGGRAAEELILNTLTTGAQDDIKKATSLAEQMICEWGMSSLGTINYKSDPEKAPDNGHQWSEAIKKKIDDEITKIINIAYEKAREIVSGRRAEMQRIAEALLEKETLTREEIEQLVQESP